VSNLHCVIANDTNCNKYIKLARVNQQPTMHQFAVLSSGWAAFFHSVPNGVHQSPFFSTDHCIFFLFLFCDRISPGPDLTPIYPAYFSTLISTAPTLVPYLLFPTNIATLITSYPIDLVSVLTVYPANMVILLITYLTNLTIVLTTYPTDLTTLHTQPLY
jgi:hypothetical protein